MSTVVLLPVKDQGKAKARMAPLLAAEERTQLAWAMFSDVSRALEPLSAPIVLVTDSERAAHRAAKSHWRIFWEASQISESASVDAASTQLAKEGITAVLRLPADVPLIQTQDIELLLSISITARSTILVPSRDHLGTNAVLRAPPDLYPSRFGHNSLVLHIQEALRAGARLGLCENQRIALDLDDASDIAQFLNRESDTETFWLLQSLKLQERGLLS